MWPQQPPRAFGKKSTAHFPRIIESKFSNSEEITTGVLKVPKIFRNRDSLSKNLNKTSKDNQSGRGSSLIF